MGPPRRASSVQHRATILLGRDRGLFPNLLLSLVLMFSLFGILRPLQAQSTGQLKFVHHELTIQRLGLDLCGSAVPDLTLTPSDGIYNLVYGGGTCRANFSEQIRLSFPDTISTVGSGWDFVDAQTIFIEIIGEFRPGVSFPADAGLRTEAFVRGYYAGEEDSKTDIKQPPNTSARSISLRATAIIRGLMASGTGQTSASSYVYIVASGNPLDGYSWAPIWGNPGCCQYSLPAGQGAPRRPPGRSQDPDICRTCFRPEPSIPGSDDSQRRFQELHLEPHIQDGQRRGLAVRKPAVKFTETG